MKELNGNELQGTLTLASDLILKMYFDFKPLIFFMELLLLL